MRALIQRVTDAAVSVNDAVIGQIGHGLLIFLGVERRDSEKEAAFVAEKCVNLRIFADSDGKFNLSAMDIGAEILVVSQFTLYGDTRKGRRPSFGNAAPPDISEPLYRHFVALVKETGLRTATGRFGAVMNVSLTNDGPVTILVDKEAGYK